MLDPIYWRLIGFFFSFARSGINKHKLLTIFCMHTYARKVHRTTPNIYLMQRWVKTTRKAAEISEFLMQRYLTCVCVKFEFLWVYLKHYNLQELIKFSSSEVSCLGVGSSEEHMLLILQTRSIFFFAFNCTFFWYLSTLALFFNATYN